MLEKIKREEIIKKYGLHQKDTGSSEVCIALLTEQINQLSEHLKIHKKDFDSRKGLIDMVGQRRKLLKYLAKNNKKSYQELIKKLGLRK